MMEPLRVLLVEDSPTDAKLVLHALSQLNRAITCERVETEPAMREALTRATWDLVISDWSMPKFSAAAALAVARSLDMDLPFIIVSGTIGEEYAVTAMRAGANDYVLKDNLIRLPLSVERELREHETRVARRRAEAAQREAELRFSRLFGSGIIGIFIAERSGRIVEANDTFLEMVGYAREDVVAETLNWREMTPDEWRPRQTLALEELEARGSSHPFEHEYLHKGGARTPVLVGLTLIDQNRVLTVVTNLTQSKRADELKSAVIDTALDAVIVMDHTGVVVEFNPAAERTFGFAREQAVGSTLADLLIPERHRAAHVAGLARYLATRTSELIGKRIELSAIRKDGVEIPVELSILRYGPDVEPHFVGFIRDVSERRRVELATAALEEQLRQSQKMEAVGRLAGGVAHDFNNLLSVVLGYSEMVLADLRPGDPIRDDLEEIRRAGKRGAELTKQLLTFSRQQVSEPKVLNLNEVLSGMEKMLRRLVGEDIELCAVPHPALGSVYVDPGSMEQIIMNLVVNARDAMPTGGKLTMETDNVELDSVYVRSHLGAQPGSYVMLSVTDSGSGMDKATLARIFEPFFTTKDQGKGTGLGLSTVFGIVQQSSGNLWVYSEPGVGTTFKIYFPRTDVVADPVIAAGPTTLRGSETILLLEDEEQVRDVTRGILKRHGYTILEALNAGEALLICEKHPQPIDLLLTDIVMPQVSGPELARRLVALRPEMKVLCMSGYTDDAVVRHGMVDATFAYLQKPITVESLTRKVREVLDAPASPTNPPRPA